MAAIQKKPKKLITGYFGDRRSKEYNSSFYCATLILETTPSNQEWGDDDPYIETDYDNEVSIRCSKESLFLKLMSTSGEDY